MSDNGDVGETKAAAWTDAAKFQFLLRIVAVMREDGRPIPWSKINMPGRTTKSLQNMWTKIQKETAALDDGEGTLVATPRKSTPAKARAKRAALQGSDAEDDADSTTATPRKRAASGKKTPKSAKKAKKEESDSEADGVKKEEPVDEI
ncbi:hypothetical protein ACRE_014130 [Hapsidospora chrysogenum ATCC 11550]|uniref:Uncharacterized protein n=1 Tax=Hapsidospora chrysogenum (strain ATCC 11550 / CBS 779.69 / DSM 880 / IAM 14645 / JCM 23072 / IMI 49137) TaxID=857340 RepID=A0A086TEC3_HAPC1|nr:hypothetical protein ACRE_014130 [Hapsidospora chrysogenum ATCC 11550]